MKSLVLFCLLLIIVLSVIQEGKLSRRGEEQSRAQDNACHLPCVSHLPLLRFCISSDQHISLEWANNPKTIFFDRVDSVLRPYMIVSYTLGSRFDVQFGWVYVVAVNLVFF